MINYFSTYSFYNCFWIRISHDENTQKKWTEFFVENNININDINKHSLICSAHFEAKYIQQYKKSRQLTRYAIPTIIVSRVFSVSYNMTIIYLFEHF